MFKHFNVYVGCGLTRAPQSFRDYIESFKADLREFCTVLCFKGIGMNVLDADVYEYDIDCVLGCDLMVAVSDEPSTGLGIEAGCQIRERGKPFLGLGHKDSDVTHMLTGMWRRHPNFAMRRYVDLRRDGVDLVRQTLALMDASTGNFAFPSGWVDPQPLAVGAVFSEPKVTVPE